MIGIFSYLVFFASDRADPRHRDASASICNGASPASSMPASSASTPSAPTRWRSSPRRRRPSSLGQSRPALDRRNCRRHGGGRAGGAGSSASRRSGCAATIWRSPPSASPSRIQLVTLNWEALTGGSLGMTVDPAPLAAHVRRLARLQRLLSLPGGRRRRGSSTGRSSASCARPGAGSLKAIREDETAALALGKDARALPPAGLRARLHHHRPGGRALCRLHRLRQPVRFPADPDLPDLGDADRRRQRQQPRRAARRADRLGAVVAAAACSSPSSCRSPIRRRAARCSRS